MLEDIRVDPVGETVCPHCPSKGVQFMLCPKSFRKTVYVIDVDTHVWVMQELPYDVFTFVGECIYALGGKRLITLTFDKNTQRMVREMKARRKNAKYSALTAICGTHLYAVNKDSSERYCIRANKWCNVPSPLGELEPKRNVVVTLQERYVYYSADFGRVERLDVDEEERGWELLYALRNPRTICTFLGSASQTELLFLCSALRPDSGPDLTLTVDPVRGTERTVPNKFGKLVYTRWVELWPGESLAKCWRHPVICTFHPFPFEGKKDYAIYGISNDPKDCCLYVHTIYTELHLYGGRRYDWTGDRLSSFRSPFIGVAPVPASTLL